MPAIASPASGASMRNAPAGNGTALALVALFFTLCLWSL